ncbi:MAG: TlpA disulfide reductase family protein [Thiogranum sp.]|nr:TlpA disulfide reductase family protein [Thiogranum sp.]
MKHIRALIVILVACMGLPPFTAAGPAENPTDSQPQLLHPVPGVVPAPEFRLQDMDGNWHRLSDYRGKVVVINFWATWCPPCREEMPAMQRAWLKFENKNIVMLAINVGEDEDTIFNFTASYPVEFPLLLDTDSAVINAWPVRGLPTTFVIDPQGTIAYQAIGSREWDDPHILKTLKALRMH